MPPNYPTGASDHFCERSIATGVGWVLVGFVAFLPAEIGTFALIEHFTSRSAHLARNPPDCAIRLPAHGVYWKYPSTPLLGTLTIKTSAGANYFVKLVNTKDDSTEMEFFIHGGEILTADVPVGSFRVKYADGLIWCGESELFGPFAASGVRPSHK